MAKPHEIRRCILLQEASHVSAGDGIDATHDSTATCSVLNDHNNWFWFYPSRPTYLAVVPHYMGLKNCCFVNLR